MLASSEFDICMLSACLLFPIDSWDYFLFCNIDINLIYLTEMCKNLLYPYSQTPKDISLAQPEGCFPVGCPSLGQGICLSEGRWIRAFLPSRLGRWWRFPLYQVSSLDDHAVGRGRKLYLTVCGQGQLFLTSSVTLLLTELWNSLPQASMEAKALEGFQQKQGLFPG